MTWEAWLLTAGVIAVVIGAASIGESLEIVAIAFLAAFVWLALFVGWCIWAP